MFAPRSSAAILRRRGRPWNAVSSLQDCGLTTTTTTSSSKHPFLIRQGRPCPTLYNLSVQFNDNWENKKCRDRFYSSAPRERDNTSSKFHVSWQNMVDELIRMPLGNMKEIHFHQAQELIKGLRTHRALDRSTVAALAGFHLLDRLAQECQMQKNSKDPWTFPMDLRVLGAVIGAWKRILRKGGPDTNRTHRRKNHNATNATFPLNGPEVYQKVEFYRQVGLFEPNVITYNVLMDSLHIALPNDAPLAVKWGEDYFQRMRETCRGDPFDSEYHPNQIMVLNLIKLWTRSGEPVERAEGLVRQLEGWYRETRRPDMQPTLKLHAVLVKAHHAAASSVKDMIHVADDAWQACIRGDLTMDLIALNIILHTFAATKEKMAADAATVIFEELLSAYRNNGHEQCCPNQSTFLAVLTALGRTGQAERAEDIMRQMEDLYHQTSDPGLRPNKACYGALIWAYVKIGDSKQAEATLLRMSNMCALDADSWNGVFAAWAQSGEEDAAERTAVAIEWLEKQSKKNESSENEGRSSVANVTAYNSLMGSYARHKNPQQGARLATDLFQWMRGQENVNLQPNGITYLALITAWINAQNPEQAESVLRLACRQVHDNEPDAPTIEARHFNLCMSAWADSKNSNVVQKATALRHEMERIGVIPTIVTYNSLLKVFCRHGHQVRAGEMCLSLLREAQEMARSGQIEKGPDKFSYNTAMAALVRSRNPRDLSRVMALFGEMKHRGVEVDRATYNNLMSLYARLGNPGKVESIFRSMQAAAEEGETRARPHFKAYSTLLNSWAKAGNPQATLIVLEEMIEMYENGKLDGKPGTRDFNAVLHAWLMSNQSDAASEAMKVLDKMNEFAMSGRFHCAPDRISYNIVIRALCLESDKGPEALSLLRMMQSRDLDVQPDLITYSQVLDALVSSSDLSTETISLIDEMIDELLVNDKDATFWVADRNTRHRFSYLCRQLLVCQVAEKNGVLEKLLCMVREKGIKLDRAVQSSLEDWNPLMAKCKSRPSTRRLAE